MLMCPTDQVAGFCKGPLLGLRQLMTTDSFLKDYETWSVNRVQHSVTS